MRGSKNRFSKSYLTERKKHFMKEIILIITIWIVTICTYISYIPQIVKLIKTKESEDLSVASWVLWTISSIANLIYSLILGRAELVFASTSEFFLILTTLVLTIYYGYKNNYYLESEERFQERINKIRAKDGNHMLLLTTIKKDREKRKENRNKLLRSKYKREKCNKHR